MHRAKSLPLAIFLLSLSLPHFGWGATTSSYSDYQVFPYLARLSLWGYEGDRGIARGDGLFPLMGDSENIFYGDVQGKVASNGSYLASGGTGFRHAMDDARILGTYVFADRSVSIDKQTGFWFVSPGIESMGNVWDFRINGYFPVSQKKKLVETTFADNVNIFNNIVFRGHDQFDQLVNVYNEVGPGTDGEIGLTLPFLPKLRSYVGSYYFKPQDRSSIQGIEARAEYQVSPYLTLEAAGTHDNEFKNAGEIGVRFTLGSVSSDQVGNNIERRILDPVPRYLGAINQGSGAPIVEGIRELDGLVLEKSNIWFFTPYGTDQGIVFSTLQCTAEHPCIPTNFNQQNVNNINGIMANANMYLATGIYPNVNGVIMGTPLLLTGTPLLLNGGQSIFGRTLDFKQPALYGYRPLLLGSFNLAGNNLVDSISLLDSVTTTTGAEITAITLNNAPNVVLSNDDINASAIVSGNLPFHNNFASGIYANNSQVSILYSTISGNAIVQGSNFGFNFATGLGGNAADGNTKFNFNNFIILNSSINGHASVAVTNFNDNFATGLGGNADTFSGGNSSNLIGNNFIISNSHVSGNASVGLDNSTANPTSFGTNFAASIGGNAANSGCIANFTGNNFLIENNSVMSSNASIGRNNSFLNLATGIGGNSAAANADFIGNNFVIRNSNISSNAMVSGNNISPLFALVNFATGIGGNNPHVGSAIFGGNTFVISNSSISGLTLVGGSNNGPNFSTGIGGNASGSGSAAFTNNTIKIQRGQIGATALVGGNNTSTGTNQAIGINLNGSGNTLTANRSTANVIALVAGNNAGKNKTVGLRATGTSKLTFASGFLSVFSIVNGTNTGVNTAKPTSGAGVTTPGTLIIHSP